MRLRFGPPAARIFIASTVEDLVEYRRAVAAAARATQCVLVMSEDWTASGRPTVQACIERVGACDGVIAVLGHRYGWKPPKEAGGNGESSITRLEIQEARRRRLPVFPFLVDPQAPWPDQYRDSGDDAQRLSELKRELDGTIAARFQTPEQLREMARAAIEEWLRNRLRRWFVWRMAVALTAAVAISLVVIVWIRPSPSILHITLPSPPAAPAAIQPGKPGNHIKTIKSAGARIYRVELENGPPSDGPAFLLNGEIYLTADRPAGRTGLLISDRPPTQDSNATLQSLSADDLVQQLSEWSRTVGAGAQVDSLEQALSAARHAGIEPKALGAIFESVALRLPFQSCDDARRKLRWARLAVGNNPQSKLSSKLGEIEGNEVLACPQR